MDWKLILFQLIFVSSFYFIHMQTPLILTPFIHSGNISGARKESEVHHKDLTVRSYSGFFTVNKFSNTNLFFWFFPHQDNNAPLLLWLQGGPGVTSLLGVFHINGPFQLINGEIKEREFAWTKTCSVIYVDNPAGSGFSFTDGDFAKNQTVIGAELYEFLLQFFQIFSEMQRVKFFATGESYAGKYVPAVAYTIHKKNPEAKVKINLAGMIIGDGMIDPLYQSKYGDYLYYNGFIDDNGLRIFKAYEAKGLHYIKTQQWANAYRIYNRLILGLDVKETIFKTLTGMDQYLSTLRVDSNSITVRETMHFIKSEAVRQALHVGNLEFYLQNFEVMYALSDDIYKSVAPWVSELLNHYTLLLYTGQMDIVCNYIQMEKFLRNFNFNGSTEYQTTKRNQLIINQRLAGYYKKAGNLVEVMIRNAGHVVPEDQPEWAFFTINAFISGDFF